MLAHRAWGDPESLGDLGIGVSGCHEDKDLGLTLGEPRSLSLFLEEQRAFHELDDDGPLAAFDRQRLGESGPPLLAEPLCDLTR